MIQRAVYLAGAAVLAAIIITSLWSLQSLAAERDVSVDARHALTWLYRVDGSAKAIGERARAVLVFPKIAKAKIVQPGATIGAAFGEGAVIGGSEGSQAHYFMSRTWALKREDQSYSVAIFIMTDRAEQALADGVWSIDNNPMVAVVDEALPKPSPMQPADAYAFVFGTHGVAAIVLVQSSTILANR